MTSPARIMSEPAAASQLSVKVALACGSPAPVSTSSPGQANVTVHGSSARAALTPARFATEKMAMMTR